MHAAFLVVVARPGAVVPPHVAALTRSSTPPVPFEVGDRAAWSDRPGRTLVGCWSEGSGEDHRRWRHTDRGFAVSTGLVRAAGKPWGPPARWTTAVVEALDTRPVDQAVDDLRGLFTAAVLDEDGGGVILSDLLGFAFLFRGANSDVVAIGSHPALVAHAIAGPGVDPPRDALAVAGLAHVHDRIGDGTGYVGVRTLPPGATIELRAGRSPTTRLRPCPWLPAAAEGSASLDEQVERAATEIEDEVVAGLTFPADRHVADLTGGMDSRLVLAAALRAGVADRYCFLTDGPPDLPDVGIARALAEHFHLHHESGLREGEHAGTYAEQVVAYVDATAGMHSLWTLKSPVVDPPPWVRVSGLFGEMVRSKLQRRFTDARDALQFRQRRFGRLQLLHLDARRHWRAEVRRRFLEGGEPDADPEELADTFQWKERSRQTFGLRTSLGSVPTVYPIYGAATVRAAYASGSAGRRAAHLHQAIMERAAPELLRFPYTHPGRDGSPEVRPPGAVTPQAPLVVGDNLAGLLRTADVDERTALLAEVFADASNPAWDLIDRDRAIEALGRYAELGNRERRELAGAATAAVWLRIRPAGAPTRG